MILGPGLLQSCAKRNSRASNVQNEVKECVKDEKMAVGNLSNMLCEFGRIAFMPYVSLFNCFQMVKNKYKDILLHMRTWISQRSVQFMCI